jgi:solute carrier family 25 citrate transporter 1
MQNQSPRKIYDHPAMHALFGGIAGAMEITCTYPTEYTKTVMQLYPEINKLGAVKCAVDTIKTRGALGT